LASKSAYFDLSAKKLNLMGQWLHRGLASSKGFEYAFSWKIENNKG